MDLNHAASDANSLLVQSVVTGTRKESPVTAVVRFSNWLPEPPADPNLLRRVQRLRWEKGVAGVGIGCVWGAYVWFICTNHGSGLGGIVNVLLMATTAIWLRVSSRRASPYLADLLDLPAVFPQFPVELNYRVNSSVYGADQGIVSFVEGWMHFQGRRTTWSLNPQDLHVPLTAKKSDDIVRRMRWKNNQQEFEVEMMLLDQIEGLGGGLRKQFDEELVRWQGSRHARSDDIVLPPAQPSPELLQKLQAGLVVRSYALGAALVALLGTVTATVLGAHLTLWPSFVLAAVLAGIAANRQIVARSIAIVAGLSQVNPVRRRAPSLFVKWVHAIRVASVRRNARGKLNAVTSATQFPVEARYSVVSTEYAREWGIVTVEGGWILFRGSSSTWSFKSSDAKHVDPSVSWRTYYEEPVPFEHVLEWDCRGASAKVTLAPLVAAAARGLRPEKALASALLEWESFPAKPSADSVLPPAQVLAGEVRRMEADFTLWSQLKLVGHLAWVGGLCLSGIFAWNLNPVGLSLFAIGLVLLFTGEYKRGKLADRLDATRSYLEGGDEVTFRRKLGPWWKRIDKPWVK